MFETSVHKFLYKWTAALLVFAFALGAAGVGTVHAAPKIPTTTSVSFSDSPTVGAPLTIIATVAPSNATGSVSFTATLGRSKITMPASCASVTVSGGSASCTFTPANTGTYEFTAKFTDTKVYASSTGKGSVVVKLATSTALSFSASPTIGSPVTVTATVNPAAATGTVAFAATLAGSGVSLPAGCAAVTLAAGSATCTFTPATAGTYDFTAIYSGNPSYAQSSGNAQVTVVTVMIATTTVVTCPANVTYDGTAQTPCSVSVTGAGGLNLTPNPEYANNVNPGTATASYTFAGDATYAGSSDMKTFTIDQASSTTTTVVTDNATTIPDGPAPVTFGGTIVFTATVSSASGTPDGTVQWTLSHDAPYYGIPEADSELDQGSGIVGACQGDVPVVNGIATCEVTPGYYYDSGNGIDVQFIWGIRATAAFTPAPGSAYDGSSGDDATTKITLGPWLNWCFDQRSDCPPPYPTAFPIGPVLIGEAWPLSVEASDSLNRGMVFQWCVNFGLCTLTSEPSAIMYISGSVTTGGLGSVCPEGVVPMNGSFECWYARAGYSVSLSRSPSGVPPMTADSLYVTVDEGQIASNTGSWNWELGQGIPSVSASVGSVTQSGGTSSGTWSWSFATTDGPAQSQLVPVNLAYSDGATVSALFLLTVTNVAPGVSINGAPTSSPENTAISLTSTVTDPSTADTAAGFTYAWSVTKNGGAFASGTNSNFSFTPDASGTYVVTLNATDKDGGTGPASQTITVTDVP
jgi:Bacterial Ig-like domain (group 3)/PKD domain